MDDYLSSIDRYIKEKEQESDNQQFVHETVDISSLLGDAESCLQSLSMPIFPPFYNENELLPSSTSSSSHEMQDITFMPFVHPSETGYARKKPGRKPKGTSPAIRKAQNRAAQRAFRERKERHVGDLEKAVHDLKVQRQKMAHEMRQLKSELQASRVECWYMRGCVLTLQFLCLVNHVKIPLHMPYLEKEYLAKIKGMTPMAESAYNTAKAQNDKELADLDKSREENENEEIEEETEGGEKPAQIWLQGPDNMLTKEATEKKPEATNNMEAIEVLRKLLGPFQSGESESSLRMKPTLLQEKIPHDPRINIIPLPYMRDRMILFRNIIDFDKIFHLLMNEAVFYGGDPTLSKNWELPPHVFEEFWFLRIKLSTQRAIIWRKARGLPETHPGDWNILPESEDCSDMHSAIQVSVNSPESTLYENFARSPQSRKAIYPPTLENIVKVMELR
ncbi:hypothetical protein G6F56_005780 [Rhizopus delemar]|uniref:DNA-binding transcription factor yap1 n=1 Tax=Rhizopus stolonifer TaxID=4846 RepID=A0A367KKK2_RHIST|nr:hypothetical protein G6F56_005780 [Rhizopus delemar]RCI02765.1 DNA-binding transcription factor yap1 [Rhizopus stolonifer]